MVRHVEVTGRIRRQAIDTQNLAEGGATGGDYRPVPLGIPLLDPAVRCDIEVASGIRRKSRDSVAGTVNHGPVALGVPLLDPATEFPVCRLVFRGIDIE